MQREDAGKFFVLMIYEDIAWKEATPSLGLQSTPSLSF
jgi:hypothetical protein